MSITSQTLILYTRLCLSVLPELELGLGMKRQADDEKDTYALLVTLMMRVCHVSSVQ